MQREFFFAYIISFKNAEELKRIFLYKGEKENEDQMMKWVATLIQQVHVDGSGLSTDN